MYKLIKISLNHKNFIQMEILRFVVGEKIWEIKQWTNKLNP